MMPREVAPDHTMAKLNGTQPELMGITNNLKMAIRSRSRLLARLVRGQITGTVQMVVITTHQLANLSNFSYKQNNVFMNKVFRKPDTLESLCASNKCSEEG